MNVCPLPNICSTSDLHSGSKLIVPLAIPFGYVGVRPAWVYAAIHDIATNSPSTSRMLRGEVNDCPTS